MYRFLASMSMAFILSIGGVTGAISQDYPEKPINVIIPFSAGGGTDIAARAVLERMSHKLGHPFIIDNRPGAGTTLGTHLLQAANPDGYTIGFVDPAFAINPSLRESLPYDSVKDFTPISLATTNSLVLVVPSDRPWKTIDDFVAAVKADPESINFASASIGSAGHLAAEQLWSVIGRGAVHIPYGGAGQALTDLVGGQVDLLMIGANSSLGHIQSGRIRALALTGAERSKILPDVPTFIEAGLPEVSAQTYAGMIAPAGVPEAVVNTLHSALKEALSDPEVQARLDSLGLDPSGISPDEFADFLTEEMERWRQVIEAAGIERQAL